MEKQLKDISVTVNIIFLMVLVMYSDITENKFLLMVALVCSILITIDIIVDIVKLCKEKIKRKRDS